MQSDTHQPMARCLRKMADGGLGEWINLSDLQAYLGRDARAADEAIRAGYLQVQERKNPRGRPARQVKLSPAGWRAWATGIGAKEAGK